MKQPIKMMKNNDENLNTKNQTLFFGIPKGDFLQKVPFGGVWGKTSTNYKPDEKHVC